jgi:hemoglobin-like flavoprotein
MDPPADCCTPLTSNGVGTTDVSLESQDDNDDNDAEYDEFLRFVYFDKLRDDTDASRLYATQKKNHGPTAYEVSSPNEDEAGSNRNNSSNITLATLDTIPDETKMVYKQQEYYTENESTMMTTSTTTTGGSSIEIINDTKDNNDSNNISINNNNNNDDWMRKCIHIAIEYCKNTFTILTENINLYIINIDTWYNAVKHNTDISYNIQSTYQTIMFHVELFILWMLTSFGYLLVFFFATFISSESDDTFSSSITRCNTANIKKEDQVEDNISQNIIKITDPTTDTTTTTDAIKSRDDNTDAAPNSTSKENHKREKENIVVALPTPEQLELVQTSWAKVVPIADVAADLFYNKLFELDPALRPLFPDKMVYQKSKLMKMLDLAVDGLTNLEELVPKVQNLGRRHAHYFDATPPMYATVGAALLYTLKKGLGDSWDEAHEEAWTVVYGVLSSTMIDAGELLSKSSYSSLSIIREDIGIDTIHPDDDRGDEKKMQKRISITEKYIRTTPPIDFRTEQIQKIKSLTAALFEDKTTVNDEKKSMDENYWVGI